MDLKTFLKNFLGFFILCNVVFIIFNMLIRHRSWDEIDHMLNLFSAIIFSTVVGISKARK